MKGTITSAVGGVAGGIAGFVALALVVALFCLVFGVGPVADALDKFDKFMGFVCYPFEFAFGLLARAFGFVFGFVFGFAKDVFMMIFIFPIVMVYLTARRFF